MKQKEQEKFNTELISKILLAQIKRGFYISTQEKRNEKKKGSTD
jgi:hypothetical protein